jgi:ADP-ribosylglycohydrolase
MSSYLTNKLRHDKYIMAQQNENIHQRAIGCLCGLAIGDALGTLCEFERHSSAKRLVDRALSKTGHFSIKSSQITDDTEMSLALARSLIRCRKYEVNDVTQSYVNWFNSESIDIGHATHNAFSSCRMDQTPTENYQIVMRSSNKLNMNYLSNGCLMRVAPLGIAGVNWDQDTLEQVCRQDCQLTNPHQIAQDSVLCYVHAIKTAILTGDVTQTVTSAINMTTEGSLLRKTIVDAIDTNEHPVLMMSDISRGTCRVREVANDSAHQGYLGLTLHEAFSGLVHTDSFEDLMKNIMYRGGDTDTNCAVAGALYGAVHGYEHIPSKLIEQLLNKSYMRADKYPWGQTHDLALVALTLCDLTTSQI